MLKTLLITTDFPPRIGGVAEYLSQISSRLPSSSISVFAQPEKDSGKFDSEQHYRIYRENFYFTSHFIWPKWLLLLFSARKLIKKDGFQQILVGQILPVGTVALLINLFFGIPYVVSTHAMDITILSNSRKKTRLAKEILKHSRQIVTVSHFTKKKLTELGVEEEKICIISPGTDLLERNTEDFQDRIIEEFGLNGKRILLTVGRIVERKGHIEVLKSLPFIIKKIPNTHYIITSNGPYKKDLEIFIDKNHLRNYVTFVGEVSRDQLSSFYRLAEVFVMPTIMLANSDVEGFGIVYLEANAFGKPVVGYDTGGVGDAIVNRKTGILIEPRNPSEIAKNIIRLFEDTNYANKLGKQGRIRVESEFTWEVRAEKFKDIL
ncbi:glycosyltransferase family 4 protein [Patescibacteria group bacterium]|nr:glycosyltransferase family 4 protein [Patescibacteria group bacterium]MBU1952393.1 glycosyltransferase family 4 protein [Patescibacteria group bacterium]